MEALLCSRADVWSLQEESFGCFFQYCVSRIGPGPNFCLLLLSYTEVCQNPHEGAVLHLVLKQLNDLIPPVSDPSITDVQQTDTIVSLFSTSSSSPDEDALSDVILPCSELL